MIKYTVEVQGGENYPCENEADAVEIATKIANGYKDTGVGVYVSFFRRSDFQVGYLNKDGNHAITGESWTE